MTSTLVVLAATLALVGLGKLLASTGVLTPARSRRLAAVLTDGAFPVLCLSRIGAMDGPTLRARASVPALMAVVLVAGAVTGELAARLLRLDAEVRRSVRFCVAMPNWIFLPLPIVAWRYGRPGVELVLLGNVGAQLFLWTAGGLLLSGRTVKGPLRLLARNAGLWGTLGGTCWHLQDARIHQARWSTSCGSSWSGSGRVRCGSRRLRWARSFAGVDSQHSTARSRHFSARGSSSFLS